MLSEIRRVKFKNLATKYGKNETFGQFAAVIARAQTLRGELLTKAKSLADAGELTALGLSKALAQDRSSTVASLQSLRIANAKRAEGLAGNVQPKIPARPEQAQRLVEHFNRQTIDQRVHALARCTAGQDDELTAALLHDIRYVNITPTMEGLLRKRFTEVNPETEGLLSAAHIADQEIEATIEEFPMLKYQVDDLTTVDEPHRALYQRDGDAGPYRLALELPENYAVEDVGGLKSALKKERDNGRSLAARLAEIEGGNSTETLKLSGRVEMLNEQNTRLLAALNEQRVKSTCAESIAAARGVAALLMPVLEKHVAIESDVVVVKDEKGNVLLNPEGLPITVSEFVAALRTRDEYGGAFLGTGSSGGGAPPSSGNGGPGIVSKPRSRMTISEKAAFLKAHGTEKYMELPQN